MVLLPLPMRTFLWVLGAGALQQEELRADKSKNLRRRG